MRKLDNDRLDAPEVTPVSADYLYVSCSSSKQLVLLQSSSTHRQSSQVFLVNTYSHAPFIKLDIISFLRVICNFLEEKWISVARTGVVALCRVVSTKLGLTSV